MPFAIYTHRCPDGTEDDSSEEWRCRRCGQRAEFLGFNIAGWRPWVLSRASSGSGPTRTDAGRSTPL